MPKIQLYIAATIDGFIAREDGALDWLFELPNPNNIDHGYKAFMAQVDLIIMGRKTYDIVMSLGEEWAYDCKTYVATRNSEYEVKTKNTYILSEINKEAIEKLRLESTKNIWLVGGGDLITQFLNEGAIDEMIISVIPIILGSGIKLFPNNPNETKFELVKIEYFETGIVNLIYKRK